jgi:hypothetical protein
MLSLRKVVTPSKHRAHERIVDGFLGASRKNATLETMDIRAEMTNVVEWLRIFGEIP